MGCGLLPARREDGEHVLLPAVVERDQREEPRPGVRGRLRRPELDGQRGALVLRHPRDLLLPAAAAPRQGLGRVPRYNRLRRASWRDTVSNLNLMPTADRKSARRPALTRPTVLETALQVLPVTAPGSWGCLPVGQGISDSLHLISVILHCSCASGGSAMVLRAAPLPCGGPHRSLERERYLHGDSCERHKRDRHSSPALHSHVR